MRTFKVVDVFAHEPMSGNPVAVVLDGAGLDTAQMQRVARWTNLSETTFVLPPAMADADYRLRIFTPLRELPFAGHPTLGSAHAILQAGLAEPFGGRLVQECGAGLVELAVAGDGNDRRLTFSLPPAGFTPLSVDDIDELDALLGRAVRRDMRPSIVDVGAVWIVAQLQRVSDLLALEPDFARSARFERRLGASGISVFAKHDNGDVEIEVRSFAPSSGIDEDPVCGSGNGSVAVFQREHGLIAAGAGYTAAQGQCVGRDGRVTVKIDANGAVLIGGACITCVDGTLHC